MGCVSLAPTSPAVAGGRWRDAKAHLAPAPSDFSLLEVRFPSARRDRVSYKTLKLTGPRAFGADYLGVAALRAPLAREGLALALVVDRPSPLMDPARVTLHLRSASILGAERLLAAGNVFAHLSATRPRFCALSSGGEALAGSDLLPLSHRGASLDGFDTVTSVAEAYDASCGLAYSRDFAEQVQGGGAECQTGATDTGGLCCPPTAMCAPAPTPEPVPPAPQPPGCTPCDPSPGRACPLAHADVCVASRRRYEG